MGRGIWLNRRLNLISESRGIGLELIKCGNDFPTERGELGFFFIFGGHWEVKPGSKRFSNGTLRSTTLRRRGQVITG